jgi:para-nitrobenzyl esterase
MRQHLLAIVVLSSVGCGNGGGTSPPDGGAPDAVPRCGDGIAPGAGQVQTEGGVVQGAQAGATWSWKGVPFAAPPIGALRWRAPEPPACREGVSDALVFGPACAQVDGSGAMIGSEDCLALNIWAPVTATPASALPVLVFIHGGGHQQGAASQQLPDGTVQYDGQRFVEHSGAILVTIDYRLGPFGFLAHPALSAETADGSGNYGMLDQIAALRWVRDNIAGFGGDPSRVMAFGESAGAVSVCRLIASPRAAGLFSTAGIESGACVAIPLADAEAHGIEIATEVGCSDAACLRGVTMEALLATVDPLEAARGRQAYDGVIDGTIMPAAPLDVIEAGQHNRVPVIIGSNTDEQGRAVPIPFTQDYEEAVAEYAAALGLPGLAPQLVAHYPVDEYETPRDALVAMMTDVKFTCTTRRAVRALAAAQTEPVFRYVFGKIFDEAGTQLQIAGAWHGIELWYIFDMDADVPTTPDGAVVAAVNAAWSGLAATGTPAIDWPAYDLTSEAHVFFADPISVEYGYRNEQCDWLDSLSP